jgi:hypothetical protein
LQEKTKWGGEDSDFVKQAVEYGFMLWFSKKISLQHIVKPHEISMLAVYKRNFRIGRSMAAVSPRNTEGEKKLFGYPRWEMPSVIKLGVVTCGYFLIFQRYEAMSKLIDIAILCGKKYQNKQSTNCQDNV